jgi:hypothetical protein
VNLLAGCAALGGGAWRQVSRPLPHLHGYVVVPALRNHMHACVELRLWNMLGMHCATRKVNVRSTHGNK